MTENLAGYGAYDQTLVTVPETMVRLRSVLDAVKYHIEILESIREGSIKDENWMNAGKYDFAAGEMSRLFRRLLELG